MCICTTGSCSPRSHVLAFSRDFLTTKSQPVVSTTGDLIFNVTV
jgi:hypothetical protein